MNICIDGLSISTLQGTGLYSYSYTLLSNLFEAYPRIKYDLIWNETPAFPPWGKFRNLNYTPLRLDRRNNDYKLLEEHLLASKAKLYHSPNNGLSIPENKVCKYVMTAHDLSPVSCGSIVDQHYHKKFVSVFPHAVEISDRIIAVSKSIKNELIKYYKVPEKKIEVIYPWCSEIFRVIDPDSARAILHKRYKIDGKYILYAGSLHVRKNLDVVIQALKLLLKQIKDINLVIAGNCGGKREELYQSLTNLAHNLGIEDHVFFTGTITYEDMPCFYNCAECAVNLSSYEGFPITAVEAVACNTPLICMRSSSFTEIVGDYAVFMESPDVTGLKDMLFEVISKNATRARFSNEFHRHSIREYGLNAVNKLVNIYESTICGSQQTRPL